MERQNNTLNIELCSDTQALIHMVPSKIKDAKLRSQIKDLVVDKAQGVFYNTGIWKIKRSRLVQLISAIRKLSSKITIDKIPEDLFKCIIPINDEMKVYEGSNVVKVIRYTNEHKSKELLPKSLSEKMYPYQNQCVDFAIRNSARILIGDEMGVGKSLQALAIAWLYQERWPLVVLCPGCLKLNWRDEILKWLLRGDAQDRLKASDIMIIQKLNTVLTVKPRVLIISYDTAVKFMGVINQLNSDFVICDQAHLLKNSTTKRATVLCPYLHQRKHVVLITGTPALSRPKEIYSLLRIIRPDIFRNFFTFANRYCDPRKSTFHQGTDFNGSSNIRQLHYLLTSTMMIRRLKKDVLKDLPSKIRQKITVMTAPSITEEIEHKLRKVGYAAINRIMERTGSGGTDDNIWPIFTQCYRLSGMAKLDSIKEYVMTLLDSDVKFVVFAHHREVMDGIQKYLRQYVGTKYIRVDGSTDQAKRHELIKTFQEDPSYKVALLSLTAAGQGFNITSASHAVFAELHWTPSTLNQAEDRLHRIGQVSECVNCHYLIGNKTLDEKMWSQIEKKSELLSGMIDGTKTSSYKQVSQKVVRSNIQTNETTVAAVETKNVVTNSQLESEPQQIQVLTKDAAGSQDQAGQALSHANKQSNANFDRGQPSQQANEVTEKEGMDQPASVPFLEELGIEYALDMLDKIAVCEEVCDADAVLDLVKFLQLKQKKKSKLEQQVILVDEDSDRSLEKIDSPKPKRTRLRKLLSEEKLQSTDSNESKQKEPSRPQLVIKLFPKASKYVVNY